MQFLEYDYSFHVVFLDFILIHYYSPDSLLQGLDPGKLGEANLRLPPIDRPVFQFGFRVQGLRVLSLLALYLDFLIMITVGFDSPIMIPIELL